MRRWPLLLLLLPPTLLGMAWLAQPTFSFVGALRPGLEAVDEDADGRLSSSELARSSPTLTSFHKIDQDEDGALSEPELLLHLVSEDPSTFDGEHLQQAPSRLDRLEMSTHPKPVRVLRVLFEFMVAEVITADRRIPLPSDEQIHTAAYTGSLDSEESKQVIGNLVAAYDACHLEVPGFLAHVPPVMAEPGLRQREHMGDERRHQHPDGQSPPEARRQGGPRKHGLPPEPGQPPPLPPFEEGRP